MAGIGPATSPLPRECSTTEPHGPTQTGAGEGNRTLVVSLENFCSTIELHPHDLYRQNDAQLSTTHHSAQPNLAAKLIIIFTHNKLVEGEGFEPSKAEPSDLQSDPFDRSGTPPNEQMIIHSLALAVNDSLTPNSNIFTKYELSPAVLSRCFFLLLDDTSIVKHTSNGDQLRNH